MYPTHTHTALHTNTHTYADVLKVLITIANNIFVVVVVVPDVPRFPTAARTNPCWNIIYTLNFGGYNAARNIQCKSASLHLRLHNVRPIDDFRFWLRLRIRLRLRLQWIKSYKYQLRADKTKLTWEIPKYYLALITFECSPPFPTQSRFPWRTNKILMIIIYGEEMIISFETEKWLWKIFINDKNWEQI